MSLLSHPRTPELAAEDRDEPHYPWPGAAGSVQSWFWPLQRIGTFPDLSPDLAGISTIREIGNLNRLARAGMMWGFGIHPDALSLY